VINGRQYFNRRGVRQLSAEIKQYGNWAPLVLGGLILVNTLIPLLPRPIPMIEIVTGTVFSFWPSFILVWITQIISSIAAYYLSKSISGLFLRKIIRSKTFSFYNDFISKRGVMAIFVIRATMTAPFNIGMLAGLTDKPLPNFIFATTLGVIPEAAIFTYLGTLIVLRVVRFRLWYILAVLVVLSILPSVAILTAKITFKKHRQQKSA
jgi:uncharacterized membrane protein YdjX (TVP38/TMEM64 family)